MSTKSRWFRRALVMAAVVAGMLAATALAADAAITWTIGANGVSGDTSVAATGFQAVDLVNDLGPDQEFGVFRLPDGSSAADFRTAHEKVTAAFTGPDAGKALAAFVKEYAVVGGGIVASGRTQRIYVDLEPGAYVITGAEGGADAPVPHYLSVTVSDGPAAAAPAADLELHLADFDFDFPDTLPAGPQLWHVQNTGAQTHIAALFKLHPGKTQDDLLSWFESMGPTGPAGPPPADDGGMVDAISPDQSFYVAMDLEPGTYVAVCFMPDTETGQPHVMKGMIQTFTVM
ncbi:MAG: hypothetical protein P8Z81_12360 [Deinococcales bacterium]